MHQTDGTLHPKNSRYRVVVDTSVLISALFFGGKAKDILTHIVHTQQMILSEYIIEECINFAKHTLPKTPSRTIRIIRQTLERFVVPYDAHQTIVRDINDVPIMQLAIEYEAVVVTSDKDLLEHGMGAVPPTLSLNEYAELFLEN